MLLKSRTDRILANDRGKIPLPKLTQEVVVCYSWLGAEPTVLATVPAEPLCRLALIRPVSLAASEIICDMAELQHCILRREGVPEPGKSFWNGVATAV